MDRLLSADAFFVSEPERDREGKRDEGVETRAGNAGPRRNGMEEKGRCI